MSKFIGQGTFGCVFTPHVPCVKEISNDLKISKMFKTEDEAYIELEQNAFINSIDPDHLFTVRNYEACWVDDYTQPKSSELSKCQDYESHGPMFYRGNKYIQIVYDNGGMDLFTSPSEFLPIFASLHTVLDGLVVLRRQHYVHGDIKTANVTYNDRGKTSLIDFGMAVHSENVYDALYYTNRHYVYSPPEFMAVVMKSQGTQVKPAMNNFILFRSMYPNTKELVPAHLMNNWEALMGTGSGARLRNLQWSSMYRALNEQQNKFISSSSYKVDVYMMGICILESFLRRMHLPQMREDMRDLNNTSFFIALFGLIRGMTDYNPITRYDALHVKEEYEEIAKNVVK